MSLHIHKKNNVEDFIRKKVDLFQSSQAEEVQITEEDIELLISSLVNGEVKDLGGLIALRGFVYQYYVTIKYIVDMLHPSGAWWDSVIFELLDDIVLCSSTGIRFVQVKTGRENGKHKIKVNDLYDRKNELNSWLDKLFLNIHAYQERQDNPQYRLSIDEHFKVQFEIACNYPDEQDNYLEPYFTNHTYNLRDEEKHANDILLDKLEKPLDIFKKQGGKNVKIATKHLKDQLTPFTTNWCLSRLYINNLGWFSELEKHIKGRIQDIVDEKSKVLGVGVAEHILEKLLALVVSRTHDDSPNLDKKDLIFTKKEIENLFNNWKKEAENQAYQASKQKALLGQFDICIEELRDIIKYNWQGETQQNVLERLDRICAHLTVGFKASGEIDIYEKFLNRLFKMKKNSAPIQLTASAAKQYLIKSLKYMSVYLSFYQEHRFPYQDSSLLFNQGSYINGHTQTFATFNAQQEIEFDEVKRKIVQTASSCAETQKVKDDYYCLIIDAKESISSSNPFDSILGITTTSVQKKITDIPPNINFVDPKKLSNIIHSLEERSGQLSFQDEPILNVWRQTIEQPKPGDDTK
ncbi:dsDNA nuclease domain-containing protein [Bacillus cereus]|nr:dsDNA nuclease domain-containing protein [Bacillus cereus]